MHDASVVVAPKLGEDAARELLGRRPDFFRRRREPVRVELVFMPYYQYAVVVKEGRGKTSRSVVCVDALHGLYAKLESALPGVCEAQVAYLPAFAVGEEEERGVVRREASRHLAFMRRGKTVEDVVFEGMKYYPFYIGYFQRGSGFDFDVIDGFAGRFQGVAMRPVFMEFLLQRGKDQIGVAKALS